MIVFRDGSRSLKEREGQVGGGWEGGGGGHTFPRIDIEVYGGTRAVMTSNLSLNFSPDT